MRRKDYIWALIEENTTSKLISFAASLLLQSLGMHHAPYAQLLTSYCSASILDEV